MRRLLTSALHPIAWSIDRAAALLGRLTRLAARRMHPNAHRLRVLYSGTSPVLEKLAAAARLIEQYHARHIEHLEHHTVLIRVRPMYDGTKGLYDWRVGQIVLDERYVLDQPVEAVALLLVHECEHVRRIQLGETLTAEKLVVIERGCIDAEIAFARRLPNGGHFVSRAARRRNTVESDYVAEPSVSPSERRRRRFRPPG